MKTASERRPPLLYSEDSWHREFAESHTQPWRSEARRDYARVIHSPSFRRLQGKTQIFPGHESDFFRNRLTHSLEVAQIAESIAYRLNHDDDFFRTHNIETRVCATAGLVHDLGHPPSGTMASERSMTRCENMAGLREMRRRFGYYRS
jgi:dGTPase